MKKRLVFSVLGISFVVAFLRAIARESKKLIPQDPSAEFWCWLSGVWEAYTTLHGYAHDHRTFGNSVWENGVKTTLTTLEFELQQYPGQALESFGEDFRQNCAELRTEAHRFVAQIKALVSEEDRDGVKSSADSLGEIMVRLHSLGSEKRRERMLSSVK